MPGSFRLRKSKSAKISRPVVVDQREVENMKKYMNAKKESVVEKSKPHENLRKSLPASLEKTEELVEFPGGKYKRPIFRKKAKPVEQIRKSADNIKQLTGDKAEASGGKVKGNERPKSMPPGPTRPSILKNTGSDKGKSLVKALPIKEDEVLEWPPDFWNRSPGRVQPDELISSPISLDASDEDQTLVKSKRVESTTSTPQPQRSTSEPQRQQQQQPPQLTKPRPHPVLPKPPPPPVLPKPPPPPVLPKPQQGKETPTQQGTDISRPKQAQEGPVLRPRSAMDSRVVPRITPHAGPAMRRHTQVPEDMLMSRSFDLGEIDHHRRRALSVGDQKKKKSFDSPDFGNGNARPDNPSKYDVNKEYQKTILRSKNPSAQANRHATSVMELKDWERYWDQYQRKQYALYNVSNQVGGHGRGGLRVTDPGDLPRKPDAITKAPTPRRHTVTVGGMDLEMGQRGNSKLEKQRDVFLDHLAHRYPEHADVIKAKQGPLYGKIIGGGRKGSTSSEQGPSVLYASDSDEMMEDDDGGFLRRGGRLRSSMPVVRSPNKSTERPLGLVFLIFRNETKRALLPNEVTSVDTIRALFVRAFPDALSMQYLESKKRKIYIMDQATNVYYELEDMKDVKDRTVLKVYETDIQGVPPSPSRSPKVRSSRSSALYNSGHESDSSTRSAPPGVPRSPMRHHRQYNQEAPSKVQSLPVQPNYVYHHQMQQYASQYANMGHQDVPPNQRHSLAFIPDTNAPGPPYPPVNVGIPQSRSYNDYYDVEPSRSGSVTPTGSDYESRQRIDKMEAQLANLAALMQTGIRPGVSVSSSSLVSDSAKSSLSDLSSATPTPGPEISEEFQNKLKMLHCKATEMKHEVRNLRRMQINNMNTMKDTINITFQQIKELLIHTPNVNDMPVRFQRSRVNNERQMYSDHTSRVDRDLRDLEAAVDELRGDVLNKRCRVNPTEVETMALALSNVSKSLADLKGNFPNLQENMKSVMAGEMEVVVSEEKFLMEEPDRIDAALKRCKKLTGTLFTLKRLSSVQEKRPITQPLLATNNVEIDKRAVLENIQLIVPNHDARVQGVEAAEAARERKKRLVHNGEVLKFEKSLEMAQKQLRETNNGFVNGGSNRQDVDAINKANIPLTDTTKRLSHQERSNGDHRGPAGQDSPPKATRTYEYSPAGLPHAPIPAGVTATPAPPGVSASYIPTPQIGSVMSPSKQPATSTPLNGQKPHAHVTFSDSVIEITDTPRGAEGGEPSGKKVPPPPPPRKSSSRTSVINLSPTRNQPKRSFSPPAYENIENLNINTPDGRDIPNQHPSYGRSVSAPGGSSPQQGAIAQLASQYQQPKKPMSKFQQELAAGIYANMNRPDLQGQRINPTAVVNDPNNSRDEAQLKDFSDSESASSSQDSQAGLARKMLAAKLDRESPQNMNQQSPPRLDDSRDLNTSVASTNGVKMREGKKVPPPPPIRRTSQLSSKSEANDSMSVEEKRRSVSELQKEIMQQMEGGQRQSNGPPNGTVGNGTPERNGLIPNKLLANGDIIRTDASFAVSTRTITSTLETVTSSTQHKVTNVPLQKQNGKKNETDIY